MKTISLRLTEALLSQVDEARGPVPRERWLRLVVEQAVQSDLALSRERAASEFRGEKDQRASREREFQRLGFVRASSLVKRDVKPIPKASK
jgi:hypothetical protein